MSPIIAMSFFLAVAGAAVGLEWTQFSGVALAVAAAAGTVLFAAIDAWEDQTDVVDDRSVQKDP
jgi:hypothetical protein